MFADVTEEQARATPTASALCLGGILKHVTYGETIWVDFIVDGQKTDDLDRYFASFRMEPGETVTSLLDGYAAAAKRTEEVITSLPDLDTSTSSPRRPGTRRTRRGTRARCSCTSCTRPPSTPGTPTSSRSPSAPVEPAQRVSARRAASGVLRAAR